jgi:hypothetical protein
VLTAKLILGAGAVLAAPLFAGAFLAGAIGGAAPVPADAGVTAGGLTLTPNVAGRGEQLTVTNTSGRTLRVTVRARPWLQASDGTLAPDPSRELLARVRVRVPVFTLGPGERREVGVDAVERSTALYAALDVTAADGGETRHRLIGSLRFPPEAARYRVQVRRLAGDVLEVHNQGNTAAPISGNAVAGHATVSIPPVRILPGVRVCVGLGDALRGRAHVTLQQAGRVVLSRNISLPPQPQ